jgi:hypothetical protein
LLPAEVFVFLTLAIYTTGNLQPSRNFLPFNHFSPTSSSKAKIITLGCQNSENQFNWESSFGEKYYETCMVA